MTKPPRMTRFSRSVLYTPVIALTHPGTGRSVTLIGTIHVGQPAYYRAIHDRADALEAAGALVQYEGPGEAPDSEWADATPDERAARDVLRDGLDNLYTFVGPLLGHLGLAEQLDALHYEPSWERVDTNDLDLIRAAGPQAVLAVLGRAAALAGSPGGLPATPAPHLEAALISLVFRFARFLPERYRPGSRTVPEPGTEHHHEAFWRAVEEQRDELALTAIPSGRDAVLIWGSGHLPGMVSILEGAGYQRRVQEWLPAWRFPGFFKSAATVWAAAHRAAFSGSRRQASPAPSRSGDARPRQATEHAPAAPRSPAGHSCQAHRHRPARSQDAAPQDRGPELE